MTLFAQRNAEILASHLNTEINRVFPGEEVTVDTHPLDIIHMPTGHCMFVMKGKILFVLYPVKILSHSPQEIEYIVRVEIGKNA